jgi:hypothetical protein
MESKFDETKNNLLQSKYPPDIIGFCETFFHQNISNDSSIWASGDDISIWFLATCRDCSINLAPGTWLDTLHLLIQDKEDGIDETVDTCVNLKES